MKYALSLLFCLLLLTSLSIGAHTRWQSGLTSYCIKPFKPLQFKSDLEVRAFNSEVDSYRMCIDAFVFDQNEAAKNHTKAAQEAVDEWNNFVNLELR